ncbi:MAG: hypothetical protein KGJ84_02145 [Elusimicrobia bacterium]|nr:hypothetical protein [Elusimicrobiota bacterium]
MPKAKKSEPIRLRIRYEPASEAQRKQAIMLLASMYRDVAIAKAMEVTRRPESPNGTALIQ